MSAPEKINVSGAALLKRERGFRRRAAAILLTGAVLVFVLALLSGRYHCSKAVLIAAIGHRIMEGLIWVLELPARIPGVDYSIDNPIPVTWGKDIETVLWTIRLPRIAAVVLIGGGISVAGGCYQCVFRNPLVSEGILGVSNGASFGAVLAIFLGFGTGVVSIMAFAGGVLAVALTYYCSKIFRGNPTLLLVLSGTVVGSLLSAGNSIIKYLAPQDTTLPEITFWLMGSFSGISADDLKYTAPIILLCSGGIYMLRWHMNVMALGDDEARALGVNTSVVRFMLIALSTFITSAAVCICGIIGWVGMIIPQLTRMVVGPDTRRLIPCAFAVGSIFLMIVDMICRTLLVTEIPVGIVTSLVGAPIFLLLLRRSGKGWS